MLNELTNQINLDADTLLFVTLYKRLTDETLLTKISGSPPIVTTILELRIGALFQLLFVSKKFNVNKMAHLCLSTKWTLICPVGSNKLTFLFL